MKSPTVQILLAIGVCAGCFWLGRRTSDRNSPNPTDSEERGGDISVASDLSSTSNQNGALPATSSNRLREILANPSAPNRELELRLGLGSLSAAEIKELWIFARDHLHFRESKDFGIAAAILGRLAELDPQAALAIAARDGKAWTPQLTREVIGAWAGVDQDAAMEWIAKAGSGVRDPALRAVLEQLGDRDREAAVRLFREAVESGVVGKRAWGAPEFFNEWAKEDPPRAADAALDHSLFTGRDTALGGALKSWGASDPNAALEWLDSKSDQLTKKQHTELTGDLLGAWSNRDPAAAAAHLMTVNGPAFENAGRKVMADWAGISLADAADFAAGIDDTQRRRTLERFLVDGARNQGNRDEGIAYALDIFDRHGGLSHPLYMLVSQVVGEDPATSIEWVQKIAPNDLVLEEFYNTLLHQWRSRDPGEAAKHLHLMPDPVRRAEDYEFFASYWAGSEIDAAREWANSLPESTDRDRALVGVGTAWIGQDPPAAIEWIGTLETGELRDRITSAYIGREAENDIPAAVELANGLADPFRRDDSLEFVFGKWLGQDRDAAEAAIEASDQLSATAKWRLLEGGNYQ